MEYNELTNQKIWKYFGKLSEIPRESGNEKGVSDYLINFAKQRDLKVSRDDALNIIIEKDATKGYENHTPITLQAHMDMVCVKEDDSDHDFEKDPIKLLVDGDWVKADGTTLGADNGIGLAYILAILDEEDIKHGPIQAIITSGEETSMVGANALDYSKISGKYLLNLDSEEDGYLTIGCAGGLDLEITFGKKTEKAEGEFLKLDLRGFEGGHSGMEIDKARLNAIKALARLLVDIDGLQIADLKGGVKRNAIAPSASAIFAVSDRSAAKAEIENRIADILNESKDTDPAGQITVEEASFAGEVLTKTLSKNLVDAIFTIPNGLYKKHEGEIITSSNLGILENNEDHIRISSMIRSQIDSAKFNRAAIASKIVESFGAKTEIKSEYSGWQREESDLIGLASEVWKELNGEDLIVATTHGGLECGLFKGERPEVEMISFGPEILGAHSPEEKAHIGSTEKNYKFLKELIKRI